MRPEGQFLKLLRRSDLPREEFEAILQDRAARRYHAVRLALACHPRTPRSEALSLVSTLFWRDLARLSSDPRAHPEVRRAADRDLLRRLPEMALAERIDLARVVGRGALPAMRFDPDPRVIEALLDNRLATEPDVVRAAARSGAPPEALEIISRHPRWSLRPGVRSALLRNPALPKAAALSLLTRASREDLEGLLRAPAIAPLLRACAERVLADRLAEA